MSTRLALALALCLGATASPASAAVKLTYQEFDGTTRPLANTSVKVFNANGQNLKTLGPSDASGVISGSGISLAEQKLFIVPVPNTSAINLNPDKSCFTGFLNLMARTQTNFYPSVVSLMTSQLKSGTNHQLSVDMKAVKVVEAADKAWRVARDDLGVTVPRINTLYNSCKFFDVADCAGASACYSDDTLFAWDSGAGRPQLMQVFSSRLDQDWDIAFTLAHEVGHFVHYALNRNYWPTSPMVAIHSDYTISDPRTAWKEGFASFWANLVVAKMGKGYTKTSLCRAEDPRCYERLPQDRPDLRGIGNEGHVAAALWDIYPTDSRWADDELFSLNHPSLFKKIFWDNSGSINTAEDFRVKARALIASGGASVPASEAVNFDNVWHANMSTGFERIPYTEAFDCPAGATCGGLTDPPIGFWDVLNFAKVDLGPTSGGGRNFALSAHYGDEWYGNANTPSFLALHPGLGVTRNSDGGLTADFEVTFPEDLSYTRLRFSLMAGVNAEWPAVSFTIDPYSEYVEVVSRDPEGNFVANNGSWIWGSDFAGRKVKVEIEAEPILHPNILNRSRLILTVKDAANPADILGHVYVTDHYNGVFTYARFDHDAPNQPILIDNIVMEQH